MIIKKTENIEAYQSFLQKIKAQLVSMSEEEKDLWIISQAKLLYENQYQDFFQSLTGKKQIQYMPKDAEIDAFCDKVRSGSFYLEYETHYMKFDDSGRYYGDWTVQYNDPNGTMSFLDTIFKGCHDLIRLEKYKHAAKILEAICRLEFLVEEAYESEDFEPDVSPFSIADAYEELLLASDRKQVCDDLIYAFYMANKKLKPRGLAKKMLNLLELPICAEVLSIKVLNSGECKELFKEMRLILEEEILEAEKVKKRKASKSWPMEGYQLEKQLEHRRRLLENFNSLSAE